MRKKFWIYLALLLAIPGLVLTVSCAKKTVKTETSVSETPSTGEMTKAAEQEKQRQAEMERQKELDRQRALEEERLKAQKQEEMAREEKKRQEEIARKMAAADRKVFLKELILFDFDRSILTPIAQDRLTRKAKYLKEHPDIKVIIEGHCDERGTNEYNLALGERRAEAAKAFLVDLGISSSRLTTISYGEERPFAKGHYEGAWALNRRAHFVIE